MSQGPRNPSKFHSRLKLNLQVAKEQNFEGYNPKMELQSVESLIHKVVSRNPTYSDIDLDILLKRKQELENEISH